MGTKPKILAAPARIEETPTQSVEVTAPVTRDETTTATAAPASTTAAPEAATIVAPDPGAADIRKTMEKAMKSTEELVAFGQGNVEAFVKSGQIWSAGIQDLSKQVAATAQANLDETMNVFKAMSTAKSLKDAFDLQASFARTAFEKSMTESSKLTDASFKLTEQALAPITARVTLAVESLVKAA